MGNEQHAEPFGQQRHRNSLAPEPQKPSVRPPGDPSSTGDSSSGSDFSFKRAIAAIGTTLALAFAARSAGFPPSQVTFILSCTLITSVAAPYAYRAYLDWKKSAFTARSLAWVIVEITAAALLVGAFITWPFGGKATAGSGRQAYAPQSSCSLASLPTPPPVTPAAAASPLMYGIRSTDTAEGDRTAVAHEIFTGGWMQQVFQATGTQIASASAVISLNQTAFTPFRIQFQVLTTQGRIIGQASAVYDGSTNNSELRAAFSQPVPLKRGRLYALRVVNESGLTVAIYAHVYNDDPALTAPYPLSVCAYDSGDGGPKAVPVLDNNGTYQMLSGTIMAR